ncbi:MULTISPECIES: recombinase family protein [Intestinibacter]|jgi:DNA invertase Pin-like site-specific DNA recombinase|uniref:recombinase family protein n=1 Tax=Intestinibacter TaxID=1505657 RepID=UPI002430D7B0|nr:recombinase family protein [Intestinibacter bartlettii]
MKYGYARISTSKQITDRQVDTLEKYNLDKIYTDVVTGSNFDRPNYKKLTEEILREGDELFIKEVDRLGRNKRENLEELRKLKERGIIIRILEIPTTLMIANDETDQNKLMIEMMNNMLIEMYATFAELELQKIRTRTREALAAKKKKGEPLGRPKIQMPKNFKKVYKQYKNRDITAVQAMKLLDLKKTTFYKLVREFEDLMDLE